MAEPKENPLMEKIVSLCKRRGFIFQSSEIYGGINGFWDYGPLGAELKRNVKELWWNTMTRQREDVAGLEATIIMAPQIWKASGHVDTFTDPMIDCKTCKGRFRADQINEIPCGQKPRKMVSECHGEKTALPIPFMVRYGYKDSPQAVVIVDREGIVRHLVQAGPNAELPSNAEILRRLDAIR